MTEQTPPKHEHMLTLLERGSVYMHLDPRREGVNVPQHLRDRNQLVLQIGLNFPVPIRDLEIDDDGVRCTLSFNRQPCYCIVPWSAVYALVGDDGGVTVWPGELPTELVPALVEADRQAVRTRKPRDRSDKGERRPGATAKADKAVKVPTESPPTPLKKVPRISVVPSPPSDGAEGASTSAKESAPVEAPSEEVAAVAAAETGEAAEPRRLTRSGRELPPWLRVVK